MIRSLCRTRCFISKNSSLEITKIEGKQIFTPRSPRSSALPRPALHVRIGMTLSSHGWHPAPRNSAKESVEKRLKKNLLNWANAKEDSGVHIHQTFTSQRKVNDLEGLVTNFTAPALARALRDREQTLAKLAQIAAADDVNQLKTLLRPFHPNYIPETGKSGRNKELILPDLSKPGGLFQEAVLERIKYRLNRIPREITTRSSRRACVVLPLCVVNNEAHVLFTLRSDKLRRHKGEVCFPGGMVDEECDQTIVEAGLREMEEEIGVNPDKTNVLGILRCDWVEVKAITGVAVTPVLGFLGDIESVDFNLNHGEVSKFFTVPVTHLLDKSNWSQNTDEVVQQVFRQPDNEQHVVWGLTGYLLYRFVKLLPSVVFENYRSFSRNNSFDKSQLH